MFSQIPPHIQTLSPYVPGKPIEETEREYGISGAIKLASNENPLGPSPKAVQAIAESLGKLHLYPDASYFYLKRKLADFLGVTPDEILLGAGSNEVIELLIRTFMGDEDEAILCRGSFIMYKVSMHALNRRYVEVPMKGWNYDLEAMAERVGPRTRMIVAANPDNPSGTWFGRKPFEQFIDRVTRANPETLIVLDEAYFEYATDPDYPNSLHYHRDYPNLVTLRTFSKVYGLAGVRLGYGVMHPTLVSYLNRTRMPFNVSSLAQAAGLAAIDDQEFVEKSRQANATEREFLMAELPKLGLEVVPSQTNFIMMELKRPASPVNEQLLRRGVIVRPVGNYGLPTCLRVTVGTRPENEKLLAALKEALQQQ